MKNLLIMICFICLFLCGCDNHETKIKYETFCQNEAEDFLKNGNMLRTTIFHDKVNVDSYIDNNSYLLDSISEAIDLYNYLNEECNNSKTEYIDCSVERDDSWVFVEITKKCHNEFNCSYEDLIKNIEDKGMECKETKK